MRATLTLIALAAALVIAGCGGSSSTTTVTRAAQAHASSTQAAAGGAQQSGDVAVAITDFAFHPASVTVKAGTRITWTNHDSTAHTATALNRSFDTGTINPKASRTVQFKRPGTYHYHCLFHAFMVGTVVVTG